MKFKTALITGASRGIGKAIAILFAAKGYNVVVNYVNNKSLADDVVNEINSKNGGRAIAVKADVSNVYEVNEMMKAIKEKFGSISVLINNAGITKSEVFQLTSDKDILNLINVNILGVINCSKAVIPQMIEDKYGKIINISSILGDCGAAFESVYSATKGAVNTLTKSLAKELGPSNITVNAVEPGLIETDMNRNLSAEEISEIINNTPLNKIGKPEDVASACLFLASDEANFITGAILPVHGGW